MRSHWRDWLLRAIAGDPADMQVMYTVDGGRHLPEREPRPPAPGTPARGRSAIGNGAVDQRQTDVLGEVHERAARWPATTASTETRDSWSLQRTLVNQLAENWQEPDNGLWEIRGPRRHFTHSRVMVWAAFDRAIEGRRGARPRGAGRATGAGIRDEVREEIMERGYDAARNTFTQHYDTDRGRRLAAGAAARPASSTATTRRCSAPSRPSRRT